MTQAGILMWRCDSFERQLSRWEHHSTYSTPHSESLEDVLKKDGYITSDPLKPDRPLAVKPIPFPMPNLPAAFVRLWFADETVELLEWRGIRHEFLFPHNEYMEKNGNLVKVKSRSVITVSEPTTFPFHKY